MPEKKSTNIIQNQPNGMIIEHVWQHNIYIKKMTFPTAGTVYKGHHHDYDHVTMVASGKAKVKFNAVPEAGVKAEEREYGAVGTFITRAYRTHEITALEDNTVVCCIHAMRTVDGQVIFPDAHEGHEHDPDDNFQGWGDLSKVLGGNAQPARVAFTADEKDLDTLLKRAEKEGTLDEGNADRLVQ